ncbi:hydantoinase B/oxoprolinase family protein [Pelagovum pacificum]|uniref:Hydantoinase B/oxoprolinase family protein n=1 Tax=Pelagovum pacificum TaxID=2588711 RepID=A0A5C5GHA7_9RHOB|nr:hydantoinase B/oxoprolinase family protein [Pelagovum pacificum]QQA43563.1 hydantoinase B/oxoprolinase family protein [Pelagovum pacificum]TNY33299.1 hydantoinase B/oxoprolinase family protein [Pelagovum pacificum]
MTTDKTYDPVTFDIIQNALEAVADEMFVAQRKTSMSAIIYEVLDLSTSILDAKGEIAASGAGIPAFIGVLDKAIHGILKKFPLDEIRPGDVFASNDPYYGGVTHLNDMVLAAPVFAEDRLVAWVANIAHWNDVGGMVPGSMSSDATEIFQEGVRIPAVKLFDQGVENSAIFDILYVNTRLPDYLRGDLWAGIAGLRIGDRRVHELIDKYGADTFEAAVADFMELGETRARAALGKIRTGTYSFEEEQDTGQIHKVELTITDDEFIVDLRDNPAQAGSSNSSREGTEIAVQLAFKSFADPDAPGNGGFFRPLNIKTTPGTIFHVKEPGALGYYSEVEIRLFDMLLRALAHHFPGVVPAGNFASICGTVVGGPHPETGRHYTIVEPQVGGWGAWQGHDGPSGQFSGFHGETFNCPAEVAEARYGLAVDQLALNAGPGGEGQWRGGKGIDVHYRVRADHNFLSLGYTRSRIPPWGVDGGLDGSTNFVEVIRTDGTSEKFSFATNVEVNTGDVIRVVTANGGGYGDPKNRSEEDIARDLRNGYITPERAREIYGYEG